MDFQGQGTASTGEEEVLGIIDTTSRFVTVIALPNRKVQSFVQPFLDQIVFRYGPPSILHCDEAPEFMSELLQALMEVTETTLTTTMAHNARSNGIIEVWWRYWNRCMRLLSDDQYKQWPKFASRIAFAYNTASHQSIGGISPFQIDHGVPARDTFSKVLTTE
jgi:transposase InsO family protein